KIGGATTTTSPLPVNLSSSAPQSGPSPYSFVWENVRPGRYTLTARATDSAGLTAASPPISILVTDTNAPVAAPEIFPDGGTFVGPVTVTLTTTTPGAQIKYTLDGTDPDAASQAYLGALALNNSA